MNNITIPPQIIKAFIEERVRDEQEVFVHPSYVTEQKLLLSLSNGLIEEATIALATLNSQMRATLAKDETRSMKNSLIAICTLFTRAIINGGVNPEDAFKLSDIFIMKIEEESDIDGLKELEYEMLDSFIKTLDDKKRPTYNAIVNKSISFIHDEILKPLSLEYIASYLNVHPYYLSRIFKQEVGLSITEYISRKRIKDSKYFLLQSDLPISNIAIILGFCNQSYYTKLFKEYNEITPLQFRNKFSKGVAIDV